MKKDTRLNIAPVALLLVLLMLLILLAHRKGLTTAEEAETAVVKVGRTVDRNSHSRVAAAAMLALFAYVTWTVLRANRGDAKTMPPAEESRASDKTAPS